MLVAGLVPQLHGSRSGRAKVVLAAAATGAAVGVHTGSFAGHVNAPSTLAG